MLRVFCSFMFILLVFCGFLTLKAQEIGASGNTLPRFVSVAAEQSYMRTGPGRQYPINWTYKRKNLPLKVIEEYGPWRKVVDFENTQGWIHRSLLSSRRTAIIIGGPQILRIEPSLTSKITASLQEGVIAEIEECNITWCKLNHPQVTGWLPHAGIYGVLDGEVFD